jgi:hypothetical protein
MDHAQRDVCGSEIHACTRACRQPVWRVRAGSRPPSKGRVCRGGSRKRHTLERSCSATGWALRWGNGEPQSPSTQTVRQMTYHSTPCVTCPRHQPRLRSTSPFTLASPAQGHACGAQDGSVEAYLQEGQVGQITEQVGEHPHIRHAWPYG